MSKRRKWTQTEKLSILKEAEQQGVTSTVRKHGVHLTTFYGWSKQWP